jgi:hypothetical protein
MDGLADKMKGANQVGGKRRKTGRKARKSVRNSRKATKHSNKQYRRGGMGEPEHKKPNSN